MQEKGKGKRGESESRPHGYFVKVVARVPSSIPTHQGHYMRVFHWSTRNSKISMMYCYAEDLIARFTRFYYRLFLARLTSSACCRENARR